MHDKSLDIYNFSQESREAPEDEQWHVARDESRRQGAGGGGQRGGEHGTPSAPRVANHAPQERAADEP